MAGILKVKDGNTWVDIPAIVGPQGIPGVPGPQGLPGPKGDPGEVTQAEFDDLAGQVTDLKSQITTKASTDMALGAYPNDTVSGGMASFSDGADSIPVKDLVIAIEPVQSGSGDPSPDNVRPISGWTGANVARYGVNIWDEQWENGRISAGANVSGAGIRSINHIIIKPNAQYRVIKDNEKYTGNLWVTFYDKNRQRMYDSDHANGSGWTAINSGVVTTPPGAYSMRFFVVNATEYTGGIGFNYPSTDTDYHPGTGDQVIPITFPTEAGTVYGGTLDVTTGVLTVDSVMLTINGDSDLVTITNTETYTRITNREYQSIGGIRNVTFKACDKFKCSGPYETGLYNVWNATAGARMHFGIPPEITTIDEAKAWFAENPTQIVAQIETPRTYQLTPVEVLTLLGANTIYTDTGDTTVTYRADPTLYADKRSNATRSIIAGIEPTMTASKAYTVGQLLIVGDTLYKVAASIASGATLTPGTNVNPTTVAEQLILLANA